MYGDGDRQRANNSAHYIDRRYSPPAPSHVLYTKDNVSENYVTVIEKTFGIAFACVHTRA